ncbi:unnamed protein product [Leuciscus chuanchicus]
MESGNGIEEQIKAGSVCLHRETSCNSGFRALNWSAPDSLRYKKKVLMTARGRWCPPQARLLRMAELKMMPVRVASVEETIAKADGGGPGETRCMFRCKDLADVCSRILPERTNTHLLRVALSLSLSSLTPTQEEETARPSHFLTASGTDRALTDPGRHTRLAQDRTSGSDAHRRLLSEIRSCQRRHHTSDCLDLVKGGYGWTARAICHKPGRHLPKLMDLEEKHNKTQGVAQ